MTQKRGKVHRKWLQMCPNGKWSYPTKQHRTPTFSTRSDFNGCV